MTVTFDEFNVKIKLLNFCIKIILLYRAIKLSFSWLMTWKQSCKIVYMSFLTLKF